jgi:hypothetical protein
MKYYSGHPITIMKRTGNVARMGVRRETNRVLVGRPEGKKDTTWKS